MEASSPLASLVLCFPVSSRMDKEEEGADAHGSNAQGVGECALEATVEKGNEGEARTLSPTLG
jgi:hypothetical protein